MLHALVLAGAGVGLATLTWRLSGGHGSRVPRWLALPWTVWMAEAALSLVAPAPLERQPPLVGRPMAKWEGAYFSSDVLKPRTETPRVAVVGDSFVAGQGVHPPDTLPVQISDRLAAQGIAAEVLNLGDSGRSFFDEYVAYDALAGSISPDVVVWVFVLNDLGFQGGDDFDLINLAPPPSATGLASVDVVRRGLWARETTRLTTEGYRKALAADTPPIGEVKRLIGAIAHELHARGGRLVFTVYPLLHDLEAYPFDAEHDRLDALAREAGAEVVDLRPAFRGLDASALWANPLDHHPNAVAQALAADRVAAALAAAPIVRAGPLDCAALPSIAGLGETLTRACVGAYGDQVALAGALLDMQRVAPFLPMYTRSIASELAGRAGLLAEQAGDVQAADAARAVITRTHAPR